MTKLTKEKVGEKIDSGIASTKRGKEKKTYNSRDSPMVTHSNTNLPVRSLCTGERTGPAAFSDLWSYVPGIVFRQEI
jgi:hypothetical protein